MLNYFVRTTNERQLDKSYNQINYKKLVDLEHKPVDSFINQLKIINSFDSVLLEDDLILCKDFKKKIEEVINQYPNDIINFFTLPMKYFKTKKEYGFCYNQCTYYPKGISNMIANEIEYILENDIRYKNCPQYDILEDRALYNLKIKHIKYRPCLIQHLDNGSIMNNNVNFCRRSPYFIDYLEELGISYKEATTKENNNKLMSLMKEKENVRKEKIKGHSRRYVRN